MNKIIKYGVVAAVVVALAIGGYFAYTKMNKADTPEAIQAQNDKERDEYVAKLSKLMILPPEQPVMAKVENAEQLIAQQAFFKGAENGDVVLIFPQSAKAVIYSPSRNLVVNSGPVQSDANTGAQTTNQTAPATDSGTTNTKK